MVLTRRVGKPRAFVRGLLLSIVTAGIYAVYWWYKAHDELFQQYELNREGRDEGIVWLILGLLLTPLLLVYLYKFVSNVTYVRDRMRLPRSLSAGGFLGWNIGAFVVLFVGSSIAVATIPEPDIANPEGELTAAEQAEFERYLSQVFAAVAVTFTAFAVLMLYPYYRLQTDINATWAWFDQNMSAFTGGPPGAPPGYLPTQGQAPAAPQPGWQPPPPPPPFS